MLTLVASLVTFEKTSVVVRLTVRATERNVFPGALTVPVTFLPESRINYGNNEKN